MSGVKVGVDVSELLELLDGVRDTGLHKNKLNIRSQGLLKMTYKVGGLGVGTFLNAQVGDQVGKTVGLNDWAR